MSLTRRPAHCPPSQQVKVQVMDGLATLIARVDDDAVALVEPLVAREVGSGGHQVAQQRLVLRERLRLGCDVLFGDEEQMCRGLRIDIREADAPLIFIDTVGRNRTFNNLAK